MISYPNLTLSLDLSHAIMPVAVDPLDEVLRPPADESSEERAVRLEREEEARRVSAKIDASIKAERNARRKKRIVRLLLLGQSESGKSTTLRQFQRLYTPTAFREERVLWRAVIQLNVSFTESSSPPPPGAGDMAWASLSPPRQSHMHHRPGAVDSDGEIESDIDYVSHHHQPVASTSASASVSASATTSRSNPSTTTLAMNYRSRYAAANATAAGHGDSPPSLPQYLPLQQQQQYHHQQHHQHHHHHHHQQSYYSTQVEALKSRLSPIRHIEQLLISKLVPPNEEEPTHLGNGNIGGNVYIGGGTGFGNGNGNGSIAGSSTRSGEVFVRPTTGWRGALARARVSYPSFLGDSGGSSSSSHNNNHNHHNHSGSGNSSGCDSIDVEGGSNNSTTEDETQETLHALCDDMLQLWHDPGVREVLKRRKIRLEEGSGFFLNDLQRVASLRYMPSDDDVLKARLKTVGVAEYRFEMEVPMSRDTGTEWRIVDVGGSRSQQLHITYHTYTHPTPTVDAIIFLAPISAFDQVLSEDRTVNRLEDSVLLWKAVCSNKLLANVDLVLFLNKCDILDQKLKSGVRLAKYVRSYQDRDNDLDTVSKCEWPQFFMPDLVADGRVRVVDMRSKFSAIHREHSPNPRKFYAFCTSVTDTTTTSGIIASVRDMVIRQHLKQSKLL
ncbi:hypothetical protein D9756_008283 [Leucocoprinus leucothites]|uniref:Guanine nucleotide-binding protein alpha-4 subunit n=1 Tax=Leucocoprinus leucothites TaxID=201217 RepID=A0A8H5CZZ8_9AGAR|nr:hypothetical protein D9756_008283 [Leucoagaricus leucothites]